MEDQITEKEVAHDFLSAEYGPPPARVTKEKFHEWYAAYVDTLTGFNVPPEPACLIAVKSAKFMRRQP